MPLVPFWDEELERVWIYKKCRYNANLPKLQGRMLLPQFQGRTVYIEHRNSLSNYENSGTRDADTNLVVKPDEGAVEFGIKIFWRKVSPVQREIMPQIIIQHGRYFDGFPKWSRIMFLWTLLTKSSYAFIGRLTKVFASRCSQQRILTALWRTESLLNANLLRILVDVQIWGQD